VVGCLQVYTGNGKGKTTAAAGLALRAAGAGLRVFIGQFIKDRDSSEMVLLRERCPEVTVEQFGAGGFIMDEPADSDISAAETGIMRLKSALTGGEYDIVIADEANGAVSCGVISLADLLSLSELRPESVELVITGRDAHPQLIERADLVTEMKNVKHCFDAGITARKGIEY